MSPEVASMPTAFVAGATGYTGREVVRVLRESGVSTVAHVRPDSPRLAEWRARFGALGAEVDTTPWDAPAMATTLARVQPAIVFALLGTTRRRARAAAERGAAESYASVDSSGSRGSCSTRRWRAARVHGSCTSPPPACARARATRTSTRAHGWSARSARAGCPS